MKTTGIVRPIDELGRIVIPKELRKIFDIKEKDYLEIFVEQDSIILKKYEEACVFCGGNDGLISYNEKSVCQKCLERLDAISAEKRL